MRQLPVIFHGEVVGEAYVSDATLDDRLGRPRKAMIYIDRGLLLTIKNENAIESFEIKASPQPKHYKKES